MNNSTCHLLWRNLACSLIPCTNSVENIQWIIWNKSIWYNIIHIESYNSYHMNHVIWIMWYWKVLFVENEKCYEMKIWFLIRVIEWNGSIRNPFEIIILNLPINLENDLLIKIMTRIIEFDFANFVHLKNVSMKIIFDPLEF